MSMTQGIEMTAMVNLADDMDQDIPMSQLLSPVPDFLSETVTVAVPQSRRACEECKRYGSSLDTGRGSRLNMDRKKTKCNTFDATQEAETDDFPQATWRDRRVPSAPEPAAHVSMCRCAGN
jgi:hypothetical protein